MKNLLCAMAAAALLAASAPVRSAAEASSREKAAAELLNLMHVDRTVTQAVEVMCKSMVDQNPQLKPYQDVLRTFLSKYLSWDQLKADHVRIYAGAFTEPELRQLTTFYRTPAGQKLVAVLPDLMSQGAVLGQTKIQGHMEELQQMIRQRAKEIEAGKPGA